MIMVMPRRAAGDIPTTRSASLTDLNAVGNLVTLRGARQNEINTKKIFVTTTYILYLGYKSRRPGKIPTKGRSSPCRESALCAFLDEHVQRTK